MKHILKKLRTGKEFHMVHPKIEKIWHLDKNKVNQAVTLVRAVMKKISNLEIMKLDLIFKPMAHL